MYNKRIKIQPYPNLKISNECFERDVKNKSTTSNDDKLSDELTIIAEFKDGDKRLMRSNVVKNDCGEKFTSVSPHPIHLYIDRALEDFYKSENLKNTSFKSCANKTNKQFKDIKLLDIDIDNTHHCYNEFIKCKINSIIMITTAIEGFCNTLIPNGYIYVTSGGKHKDREWTQKTAKFESDKIDVMIPEFVNDGGFWNTHSNERNKITEIYKLRNKLIHLKTEENFIKNYSETIKSTININLYDYIVSIIDIFNQISIKINNTLFVEFSSENYITEFNKDKIDFEFIKLYLNLKNIEIHRYFELSKNKVKAWESKGVPKNYIVDFIDKEGSEINKINLMMISKYFN